MRVREQALPRSQVAVEFALLSIFAALTAASARVQLHLPFTAVPMTGQVFAVLLAGAVLGSRRGFLCQLEYLAAGAAGLPVFSHGGGLPALLGPTGGYLVAFPFAAFGVGLLAETLRARSLPAMLLACLSGVVVIYALGAAWYAVWMAAVLHTAGLAAVLAQSVSPFIAIDAAKAVLAASLAPTVRRHLPGSSS